MLPRLQFQSLCALDLSFVVEGIGLQVRHSVVPRLPQAHCRSYL